MKQNLHRFSDFNENIDMRDSYVYVYLDPRQEGEFTYGEYSFNHLPFYVGVSRNGTIHDRMSRHLRYAKMDKDITNNKYKKNIIKSILSDNTEPIILKYREELTKSEAFSLEIDMISSIGNRYDGSGPLVNISRGGDGGDTFTSNPRKEEIREKHRRNATGSNNNMFGRPLDEHPSHIAKMNDNHWNKGKKASDETRNKLSMMRRGSDNSKSKKALLFDKDFNFVKEFDYCSSISEYIGSTNKAVTKTARINSRETFPYHSTKGFYIIYKDDWDNNFKERENEIREFLKNFKKNKNQFS